MRSHVTASDDFREMPPEERFQEYKACAGHGKVDFSRPRGNAKETVIL